MLKKRGNKSKSYSEKDSKDKIRLKKILALIFIIAVGIFLFYALIPYINAFFGAFILYILLRPLYKIFNKKFNMSKSLSAILIIIISLLIIIIPLTLILNATFNEVSNLYTNQDKILNQIDEINQLIPGLELANTVKMQISKVGDLLTGIIMKSIQGVTRILISMVIMFFLLYYLLIHSNKVRSKFQDLLPFNKTNSAHLVKKFDEVTYATVISSGLIAVGQGLLLGLGFVIFGIRGAFLWGFIGAILAFLPVVGISFIGIPVVLLSLLDQNYGVAIGMLIWTIIIGNADNFIRPYLQREFGKIHPLISIIGLFIGIPFFGLFGIVVGPLLLSYFLLTIKMFKQEHLN